MNIVFLEAVQTHGGARKSTVELAKRLQNNHHDVLIIDFWGNCMEFVNDVSDNNIRLEILNPRGKAIIIKESKNNWSNAINFFSFLKEWLILRKKVSKILRDFNAEIIISNNIKTNSILKKSSKYKIIYFARGWFAYNSLSWITKIFFKYNSDYFICVSQSTRQAIYSGGLAKLENIYVVPNAIDLDIVCKYQRHHPLSEIKTKFKILHCGGFLPSKGQDISIEIAKKLLLKNIDFELILMGVVYDSYISHYFLNEIRDKIKTYNLGNNVKIVLNSKEPYKYFNETDVLIHPSATEGLPRVIMEAMAFKKPIIANPVGGVTDFILHNFTGFITNYNNVDDYIKYLLQLYNNKHLYNNITRNAYNLIKSNYLPNNQIEQFEEVLSKIFIN